MPKFIDLDGDKMLSSISSCNGKRILAMLSRITFHCVVKFVEIIIAKICLVCDLPVSLGDKCDRINYAFKLDKKKLYIYIYK